MVVVGSGFAAVSLLRKVPLDACEVTLVSPRNHFLFTPLLPGTAVGTTEYRSVVEPVRRARKGVRFVHAAVESLDLVARVAHARSVDAGVDVPLPWDRLVLAPGTANATFGVPGVAEHALFLKELEDARAIRERVVKCLEAASLPGVPPQARDRLLHFVVVGGGPTGVELAAELADVFEKDLARSYPELPAPRITLVEAGPEVLTTFEKSLRAYTAKHFARQGIGVRLNSPAAEVGENFLKLKSGEVLPAGLVVWSTGSAPSPFVAGLPFEKDRQGRILTDDFLHVKGRSDVWAMGDCATPEGKALPQTAQVAMQEGKYLARAFRDETRGRPVAPFVFRNLGMLAYVGEGSALADLPSAHVAAHGRGAFLFWRSAYLTRLVSLKNKVLVLFDWAKAFVFGRDLSTL